MRIGHGYDVHRLVPGRKLILGGVEIPFEKGLDGHSDADVLLHALADAILGAAALGDIGKLFPDNAQWTKNMDSRKILRGAVEAAADHGFAPENCDCTLIAQKPKLAPYIEQMRKIIAQTMEIDISCVSVKATTEEGLGFSGRGEGIAAHAVVLLR